MIAMLTVNLIEGGEHPVSHFREALAVWEFDFRGACHPLPILVGMARSDVVVPHAFEVAEIDFAKGVADGDRQGARASQYLCGFRGAHARTRIDRSKWLDR